MSDPCPNDTNGDGDCGRKTCARCYPQYQPVSESDCPHPETLCAEVTTYEDLGEGRRKYICNACGAEVSRKAWIA